jgi:hypothetical protein
MKKSNLLFKSLILVIICSFFFSCSVTNKDNSLEWALSLAGNNRSELEKVLNFYQKDAKDSLKYRAACFLIENMPYYYYYEGQQLDDYLEYYPLIKEKPLSEPSTLLDSLAKMHGQFSLNNLQIKYDIQEVDSAYLCNNIEWSFKVWKEQPWGKYITFDNFCEYILPYRLGNEKLVYWKEDLYNRYMPFLEGIDNNSGKDDPVNIASIVSGLIINRPAKLTLTSPPKFPRLGPFGSQYLSGTCQNITDHVVYVYRALGIPCHIDFMPLRGDNNNAHFWISIHNKNNELYVQDLVGPITLASNSKVRQYSKLKVYRSTFSINKSIVNEMNKLENTVCPLFKLPLFNDVTTYYADFYMESVTIPKEYLYKIKSQAKIAYLCLNNRMDWEAVDWAPFDKDNLIFRNINKGTIVRIATFENNKLVFQTPPFIITIPTGELSFLVPSKKSHDVTLFTKVSLVPELSFLDKMINGVFEASNVSDFAKKDTLFRIQSRPSRLFNEGFTKNEKKYRYIRYFGPKSGFCDVAEISFYREIHDTISLSGEIIGTQNKEPDQNRYTNAFDKNTETSFHFKNGYEGWVGLDLGEPMKISKIVYTPRNRDNYVKPGDIYELFYFGNEVWESLGKKTATSDFLLYKNVPENVLLFLKNHTSGTDERIFLYLNGEQVWY